MCFHTPIQHSCGHFGLDQITHCAPMLEFLSQASPDAIPFLFCPDTSWGRPSDVWMRCFDCHLAWMTERIAEWRAQWDALVTRVRETTAGDREAEAAVLAARGCKHGEFCRKIEELERETGAMKGDVYYSLPRWMDEELRLVRGRIGREGWL
ncbi:hypothetical protein MFIFM68171_04990 [Madurella fahalii]|uniref:Uncharacterized protein n=1 Tax=Madurella fahalii TaxID=1157608 RepID=A0ABQ0GAI7_9PEZI